LGFSVASAAVLVVMPPQMDALGSECNRRVDTCASADGSTITVTVGEGASGSTTESGSGTSVSAPKTVTLYDYAPACSGNDRNGEILCAGAVTSCPDQADIRYWVWTRVVDRTTGDVVTDWARQPGAVCLGPGVAAVTTEAAVAAYLANEFERLIVVEAEVRTQPAGATLVNFETGMYTPTGDYTLPTFRLLGARIDLTAKAERYDWTFGDGTGARDAGPGKKDTLRVSHTYRETGTHRIRVTVTWSGTYRINGGPPQPVYGQATTTSVPALLPVREARAQRVEG
jgi:hypothetical protein